MISFHKEKFVWNLNSLSNVRRVNALFSDAARYSPRIDSGFSPATPNLLRVVSQKAEFGQLLAELTEQVDDALALQASREVEIKQILKILARNGTALDFGEVESQRVEAAQQAVERALDVGQRQTKADLVRVLGQAKLL